MILTITVIAVVVVGVYLFVRVLKNNKTVRTEIADGLKTEAKTVGSQIAKGADQVVTKVEDQIKK